MNLFKRSRGLWVAGLVAIAASAILPSVASAKPEPGVRPRGFRMFARTLGATVVNRVYLGLNSSKGHVGVDSLGSSTIGGGYWPKGTANQYVFNSGLQIAGKVAGPVDFPWTGNTTGAFFFNARGDNEHGTEIEPVYNSTDPNDVASWPAAARVPNELSDAQQLFNPLLRGRVNASQGDVWFLTWDGDPTLSGGRPHPLGILVESRGLGWNFPAGNEDIVYFTFTFYNVTASDPTVYSNVRPEIRDIVAQAGDDFQRRNEAAFGVTIPDEGYGLDSLFAAFGADMDVASAGANYCSVNLPFALGYCYEHTFGQEAGWQFDPSIFGAPFFPGNGFVGVKYLRSPTGPGEIQLYSNTVNAAVGFRDPLDVFALFRYLSGNVDEGAGDQPCNKGNQLVTKICFINPTFADARFYQSSTALQLAPGEFGSIVVAYIFAAPVAIPGFAPPVADVPPGEPRRLSDPVALLAGANRIDSLTGFRGWTDAGDIPGVVEQKEFSTVSGSLLGKSLTAQAVFSFNFLLPFAPEAPAFFLVPGDNQVTVLWQKSASEVSGDPYFEVASSPGVPGDPNPLYDPNYRQFDVEGYRIYRGRVDNAQGLTLVAQFDYSGTTFEDYTGQVNPLPTCAIELGVDDECAADYDFPVPPNGTAATVSNPIPLVGQIIQVQLGPSRAVLADGSVIVINADTAVTGSASGNAPPLDDTGVPFTFVDRAVKNNFRYFYAVTAFDVNSFQSGPSALESAKTTKAVTPTVSATNYQNAVATTTNIVGRGLAVATYDVPSLDPQTGIFSGPQPPADGVEAGLVSVVAQVLAGEVRVAFTLDSITPGQAVGGNSAVANDRPVTHYWTATAGENVTKLVIPVPQSAFDDTQHAGAVFEAVNVDPDLASNFGGNGSFALNGQIDVSMAGAYYTTTYGRGCVNGAHGFDLQDGCDYNGSRWFAGANETMANPNGANPTNFTQPVIPQDGNLDNMGELPGVETIFQHISYETAPTQWRRYEYRLAGVKRATDYKVYWGAGGVVDSVIDAVHNVAVPFDSLRVGSSWGILTTALSSGAGSYDLRPGVLTDTDLSCVSGLKEAPEVQGLTACAAGTRYFLTRKAELGSIALWSSAVAQARTVAPRINPGFVFYISGEIANMEMQALPAAGTVWTLRTYIGAISGGRGTPSDLAPGETVRDLGDYVFTPETRSFNAVGASIEVTYDVTNTTVAITNNDLSRVHTVPDPYYVTNIYETTTDNKILKFVNLPSQAIIRIYSSSGILVDVLEHNSATNSGEETWDLRNRNNQVVASGVYFYHIEAGDARRVGRFTVVNFAQ
jgi:hypothetical protein